MARKPVVAQAKRTPQGKYVYPEIEADSKPAEIEIVYDRREPPTKRAQKEADRIEDWLLSNPEPEEDDSARAKKLIAKREAQQARLDELTRIPVGRRLPVLLITNPQTFNQDIWQSLRAELGNALKRHDRDGKLYFEVGRNEYEILPTIHYAVEFLKGYNIRAKVSVEFTPFMTTGEW